MNREELLALLAEDKLEELIAALETLTSRQHPQLKAEWATLAGRLKALHLQRQRGTADHKELEISRNQLRESLAVFIGTVVPNTPRQPLARLWLPRRQRVFIALLLLGAVTVALGMMRTPQPAFGAMLIVSGIDFRLGGSWSKEYTYGASSVELTAITALGAGPDWQYAKLPSDEPTGFIVDSGKLTVGPFYPTDSSVLSLSVPNTGQIAITFADKPGSGSLQWDSGEASWSPIPPPAERPLLLDWHNMATGAVIFTPDTFYIHRLPIAGLQFVVKDLVNDQPFISTIRSGVVQIGHAPADTLQPGDFLEIEKLQDGELSASLTPDGKALQVSVSGSAREISSGLRKLQSLRPSWIRYVYHDREWYLFAFALAWLAGMIWMIYKAGKRYQHKE